MLLFFGCMLCCAVATAQTDTIHRLDEVVVLADRYVKQENIGQKKISVSKLQIEHNNNNPTETLRFNSAIAVRDNGNGGASSARFRGTSASNTAFLWNGININSFGLGQTDLNGISLATADEIIVKSGGGSIKYGSGAIGGTVHINDYLKFKKHQTVELVSSYGSFQTTSNYIAVNLGEQKWSLKLASTYHQSKNDYELIDKRFKDSEGEFYKNENGAYKNYSISLSAGYQFSQKNNLRFYTTSYKGDRLFSGALPNPSAADEKYIDLNQRNLLVWDVENYALHHTLKAAFLTQEYRYFEDKNEEDYDFGNSNTFVFNYDLRYQWSSKTSFNAFVDLQNIQGKTNKIPSHKREQYSLALGLHSEIRANWKYNLEVKKESNSDFKVPIIISLGSEYKWGHHQSILMNISSNYRVPTLNDLYWPGQGNLDLIPETSKQVDVGYQYIGKEFTLKSTFFYIHVLDKIVWTSNGDESRPNVWVPINLEESFHKGLELFASWEHSLGDISSLDVTANYIYTEAVNNETQKQLIFVPKHLFNTTINYRLKKMAVYLQNMLQSKVYTSDDNIEQLSLSGFKLFNLGCKFSLLEQKKSSLYLGMSVKNVFNELYQYSNLRPMPGRNYNINMNYKFN
ncbi:TonB-dependent receptor [Wenyingzhuangia sp. 2_MG-2023]|nr:TonB-dependent receptor [Wenyingzhuangia sp. 2_MG-2023]